MERHLVPDEKGLELFLCELDTHVGAHPDLDSLELELASPTTILEILVKPSEPGAAESFLVGPHQLERLERTVVQDHHRLVQCPAANLPLGEPPGGQHVDVRELSDLKGPQTLCGHWRREIVGMLAGSWSWFRVQLDSPW